MHKFKVANMGIRKLTLNDEFKLKFKDILSIE